MIKDLSTHDLIRLYESEKQGYKIQDGKLLINNGRQMKVNRLTSTIKAHAHIILVGRYYNITNAWNTNTVTESFSKFIGTFGITTKQYQKLENLI